MGGVPVRAHRPYHIVGVPGNGKCRVRIFFCGKAFCHREKLINFANEKMLYNIIIQHKTADIMSAGLKNKRKNI